ncbi:MAG: methyltransferase domain-containing protein [Candidatus Nealsonbacteria bacterium]|nr:methyltransferase domain-containing protein [Candidatus Nealsonbacteria bacterium]
MKRKEGKVEMDVEEDYDPNYYNGIIAKFFPWAPRLWSKSIADFAEEKNIYRIVDIGCGPGQVTLNLAKELMKKNVDIKITGIDLLEKSIDLANEKAKEFDIDSTVIFRRGNAKRLPFADEFFDMAIATLLFPFFTKGELIEIFNEIHRILAPGGYFYFIQPNRLRLNWLVGYLATRDAKDYELSFVEHSYDRKETLDLIKRSNLGCGEIKVRRKWMGLLVETIGKK